MLMDKELGLKNFEPGGANKRAASVRKMAAQMAKKAGFDKIQSRFLAKVASLLNAREGNIPVEYRAEEMLEWTEAYGDVLCYRLTWTKHCLERARAIISCAAGLEPQVEHLTAAETEEARKLGKVLGYVEKVTEFTASWRRRQAKSRRPVVDTPTDALPRQIVTLDTIFDEETLFDYLPRTIQNHLTRNQRMVLAAA